jgi:hypothetical protein
VKKFTAVLVLSSALVAGQALANQKVEKCAARVSDACDSIVGVILGVGDDRAEVLDQAAKDCKQFTSDSGKTTVELFQRKDGKLIAYTTEGESACSGDLIALPGGQKVDTFLVQASRVWILSNQGAVYAMYADQSVRELLTSKGDSFKGVNDIKESEDHSEFLLFGQGFPKDGRPMSKKDAESRLSDDRVPVERASVRSFWDLLQ